VDARPANGMTALIRAAFFGHAATVFALMDAGADPTAADHLGSTALQWALAKGHTEVAKLLRSSHHPAPQGLLPAPMAAVVGSSQLFERIVVEPRIPESYPPSTSVSFKLPVDETTIISPRIDANLPAPAMAVEVLPTVIAEQSEPSIAEPLVTEPLISPIAEPQVVESPPVDSRFVDESLTDSPMINQPTTNPSLIGVTIPNATTPRTYHAPVTVAAPVALPPPVGSHVGSYGRVASLAFATAFVVTLACTVLVYPLILKQSSPSPAVADQSAAATMPDGDPTVEMDARPDSTPKAPPTSQPDQRRETPRAAEVSQETPRQMVRGEQQQRRDTPTSKVNNATETRPLVVNSPPATKSSKPQPRPTLPPTSERAGQESLRVAPSNTDFRNVQPDGAPQVSASPSGSRRRTSPPPPVPSSQSGSPKKKVIQWP
ncbi:MAG: ankyrin repeat domain-containing protein, partial [Acidobacteriota bacterium]|nr:ankyrin repeat domain-containing protein [Acidobacteriota bacterium]